MLILKSIEGNGIVLFIGLRKGYDLVGSEKIKKAC